ncbi:multidrug effflux MFS transporter [Mitsuokella sp.]|uniref:multidrug effflux MFS transporter n=1 Tax=Mitsuokella sp. TaxID=2049034 RepID=UPI002A80505D|nr:multidrug effflux MFS transporter [Mitsuokella sp.]MDY4475636.1 multidrug effflux MFS transporter [Mitsuokella sp.]
MHLSPRQKLFLTVFLGIMTAMAPLSTDMYLPALPELAGAFGISASLTQLTLTMTMLGMALGQIFMGPLSDRFGRKLPLLLGMLVFTAASAGAYLSEDITSFLVFRFLQGFSGASGIVIARAIARDVAEGPELTRFFAILMLVNGLAPIAAPVVGGQILRFTSWRGIFALLVLIGIAQFVATVLYRETLKPSERLHSIGLSFAKFPQLLQDRYFLGHCLLQLFFFGAFFSYIGGSSFIFQNVYHVSAQTYSLIFGGIGAGLLVAGTVPARFAGRVRDEKLLEISLRIPLLGAVFLLAGFLFGSPIWYTLPVLFVTIVPLSIMGTASFSLALSRQGKNAGSASALLGFSQMILGGVMMPLTGIAGDSNPLPMAILMLAGYLLSELVYHLMIRRHAEA